LRALDRGKASAIKGDRRYFAICARPAWSLDAFLGRLEMVPLASQKMAVASRPISKILAL
jgi:hypothetical protein